MTARPTITAAIITLDEAANLPGLLQQLDWVDEIVVVDGGSRDDTVAIARAAGVRVREHRFDNYAAQRNRALGAATGDWVLSIDADERPTARLIAEIRRLTRGTPHAAFRVPIRSTIFGRRFRFSGTQDDRPVRLFRRGAARWYGDVHERLAVAGSIGRTAGHLDHVTLPDLPAFFEKMHRYTTLEAESRVAAAISPRWRDRWFVPPREVFRRLVGKHGWLDGPQGWMFIALSGYSAWVEAQKHRQAWCQRPHAGADVFNAQKELLNQKRGASPAFPRRRSIQGAAGDRRASTGLSAFAGTTGHVTRRHKT